MNGNIASARPVPASFRDPSGHLYWQDGVLYRQVNQGYQPEYDLLMQSGLYDDLLRRHLLIPHEEVQTANPDLGSVYKIIQPEVVGFTSYPYEWCFGQLKDAALATLEIQKRALAFGMTLKDASAYNIQFHHGHPLLIDSLSFETYHQGRPWTAYRQFCQHFLAPLCLAVYNDIRLTRLLSSFIDGIPLDLAARLLPRRTYLRLPFLLHIHLHASSQQRHAGRTAPVSGQMSKAALLGLIDSLETGIKSLRWNKKAGEWSDYYDIHNYSTSGLEGKEKIVSAFLDRSAPTGVWDLGANTGKFSRLASHRNIPTLAFDIDPSAVEINYRQCVDEGEKYLLPLVMDLTAPSPAIGWSNQERVAFIERGPADTVMALALIHHLAIANNVPLASAAEFFHNLGKRLIIEFVPKSDTQVQRLLTTRSDIFPDYTQEGFEKSFRPFFEFEQVERVPESDRILYLMKTS